MKTPAASQPLYFIPEPLDNLRLAHLCGPMDENLRQISAALDVTIFRRGEKFIVGGRNGDRALAILEHFYRIADKVVSIEDVQLALVEQRAGMAPPEVHAAPIVGKSRRKAARVSACELMPSGINAALLIALLIAVLPAMQPPMPVPCP